MGLRRLALGVILTAVSIGCACGGKLQRPSVLVIIIDTLRADYLACYGAKPDLTPNMNRLASQGTRFSRCVTPVPVTLPSVTSILTSSYPIYHGVRDNGIFKVDPSLVTMAEVFSQEGYATAAVVGAYVLTEGTGVEQGFDHFDCEFSGDYKLKSSLVSSRAEEASLTQRRAEEVTNRASQWLKQGHSPFFLVAHYFDPHAPYDPPPSFMNRYGDNNYAGEVAYTDSLLAPLLSAAEDAAGENGAIIALVADHGEGLGQHQEKEHGFFIYDSTLLVPFMLSCPGKVLAGHVVDEQVATIDLAPTVLELAGLSIPTSWQGVSHADDVTVQGASTAVAEAGGGRLTGSRYGEAHAETVRSAAPGVDSILTEDRRREARACYIETYRTRHSYNWSELTGIRHDGWKLIIAPRPELYDLRTDPQEESNVYDALPERVSQMEEVLANLTLKCKGPLSDTGPMVELDQYTIDRLHSLGYVMPKKRATGPLPDPKDMMDGANRRFDSKQVVRAARELKAQGDIEEAEKALKAALELDPSNVAALSDLGIIYSQRGQYEQAVRLAKDAVRLMPDSPLTHYNLGVIYIGMKEFDAALEELEIAVAMEPEDAKVYMHCGRAYEETGDKLAALDQYYKSIELDPTLAPSHYRAAVILVAIGRTPEAKRMLDHLLEIDPAGELAEPARKLLQRIGPVR